MQQSSGTASLGASGKNIIVAYLLWWFLGFLGLHRLYLERPKTGLAQLLLLALGWLPLFMGWIVLGIWWLLDAYFVYQYVNEYNSVHGGSPLAVSLTTSRSVDGDLDYLEKLHSLRQKGVLTEDEYQAKHKDVMTPAAAAKAPNSFSQPSTGNRDKGSDRAPSKKADPAASVEDFLKSQNSTAQELRQCITAAAVRSRLLQAEKDKNQNLTLEQCARRVIDNYHRDRR